MTFSEDDRILIKDIVYDHLPCSTNKTCKEVQSVKKIGWSILTLFAGVLVLLALNYLEAKDTTERQKENAVRLEKRLDNIGLVLGVQLDK